MSRLPLFICGLVSDFYSIIIFCFWLFSDCNSGKCVHNVNMVNSLFGFCSLGGSEMTQQVIDTELPNAWDYEMALESQNACNLSGIVHSFSKVITKIHNEAREKGEGTEYVNTHPICRLYAEQIAYLSGSGNDVANTGSWYEAYKACEERKES